MCVCVCNVMSTEIVKTQIKDIIGAFQWLDWVDSMRSGWMPCSGICSRFSKFVSQVLKLGKTL